MGALTIQAKIYASIGFLLSIVLVGFVAYGAGRDDGAKIERASWQKKEIIRIDAEKLAVIEADEKNKIQEQERDRALKIEREKHESEKSTLQAKYQKLIDDSRANRISGGLRVPKTICTEFAKGVENSSTSGTLETETARLPREVEEGLYRFAEDRDQIILDFESFKEEVRISKCFAE